MRRVPGRRASPPSVKDRALLKLPEHESRYAAAAGDSCGQVAADVSVVPWLVVVAAEVERAAGIAHHEPISPRVRRHPRPRRGPRPVGVVPGCAAALAGDVDDGAQLVLRVARSRTRSQRLLVAADTDPVIEGRLRSEEHTSEL